MKFPDQPGEIAKITTAIAGAGGDITALGVLPADEPLKWWMVVKVRYAEQAKLVEAIGGVPTAEMVDARED